ncbi:hypothetical protein ACFYVR_18195 [Rhodococcus sp. NPDC003318]|uniref:hypothetical protein n=1 Tax=Rhodococcus sp. NPDC003318 TaxID=3364503 RepID=UPI0036920486
MTTAGYSRPSRGRGAVIDIAGTAWPLYKLEAVVAALFVFLTVLIVTQAMQPAVLVAAGVAVVVWWMRRAQWASGRDDRAS